MRGTLLASSPFVSAAAVPLNCTWVARGEAAIDGGWRADGRGGVRDWRPGESPFSRGGSRISVPLNCGGSRHPGAIQR